MKKIHLHIEHLSLPGYTPAERRAFVAGLERELVKQATSHITGQAQIVRHEAIRVTSSDIRPQTVAQQAVLGLNLGGKIGGGQT